MKNTTIIFVSLLAMWLQLPAQQYGYRQYHSESGAPFDQVSTVIQDQEGFIWVGSENGLYRFDGIHFDLQSLQTESQYIHQIHAFGDDLLFVNEQSLYQVKNLQSTPVANTLLEGSIVESNEQPFYPNDFLLASDEAIWVSQSNHSIGRLKDGIFQTYTFPKAQGAQKLTIQEDPSGGIWVLSPVDGLFRFETSTNTFEKQLDIRNANTLLIHKSNLLLGNEELSVFTMEGNGLQHLRTIPFVNDQVTAMHVDKKGQYIIGTRKGKLLKFKSLQSSPQTIYGANEAHRVEELDFGYIYEIQVMADSVGNNDQLWICSETGLWLLQQRFFKTVENLPMNNPISIAIGQQGRAWVPMNYLYEITQEGEEFTSKTIYNNISVNTVGHDIEGSTWVSTSTPKVELIKYGKNGVLRRYDFHDRGEAIFLLYPDSKGSMWFCQAPLNKPIVGVARINARGEVNYYDDKKGFSSRVLAIKESSRGEIYAVGIGERSYLYRYDPEADRFVNLSPPLPFKAILNFEAHDLTIDDRGIVWLATTDGLLRYDSEKITLIQNDLLGQEEVRGVTHYANDNIWISTATKGLVFHQQNTSTALGEQEGLPSVINSYRCITTDHEGRLWAGTPEGLVYSRIKADNLPYSHAPRLRKVMINKGELKEPLDPALSLRKSQRLQLEFTNLSYPATNVQYQYRLLPAAERRIMLEEQLWQSNGGSNTLDLSFEELGDYYLELRARQPGGYQWSNPLVVQLHVFLPWYASSWFVYGAIGMVILLTAYYFRFYVKKRFGRMQEIVQYSNEKLASKEAQLLDKIREFEAQEAALANASSNIETLELFIREIPKDASWNDIITAMGKAVTRSEDINAFEIAFMEGDEIVHRGYSDQERSGYTFRSKPFNTKASLTCWAMANNQEVLINDFEKEHALYIEEKEAYRFNSLLFIPFTLANKQPVALCAYSVRKHDFDQNDQTMFRILAQFIHISIHHELTKEL